MNKQVRYQTARLGARAFTLIEMILVVVIIGILAAVVIPKLAGRSEDAKIAATKATISSMESALRLFEIDNGRYPTSAEGIKALYERPAGDMPSWKSTLQGDPGNDPWGNAFIYKCPGDHNTESYDLYSSGPNGQEGDTDDIKNWK